MGQKPGTSHSAARNLTIGTAPVGSPALLDLWDSAPGRVR